MQLRIIKIISIVILFLISSFALANPIMQQQTLLTPEQALQQLEQGNQRFLTNQGHKYDHLKLAGKTAHVQHPFAIILSCIDSRGVPEVLFDQAVGNIFVTRVAGNVVGKKVLAGKEFSTKITGAKLIVVMGHNNCGAMKGACTNARLGNLTYLIKAIQPAVEQVQQKEQTNFNCDNATTIDAIAKQNVLDQMQNIQKDSPVIAKLVQENKVMIVGAMQDLATGKVDFFNMKGEQI